MELDARVECLACGRTVWESDCVQQICTVPTWSGQDRLPSCAARYRAWAVARAPEAFDEQGYVRGAGVFAVAVDAWLEAGCPDGPPPPRNAP